MVALGAMNYTYLKLTLSLRKAGFDAVLLDYDWRRDIATLGESLAERLAADGHDEVAIVGHSMGGLVARAALRLAAGKRVSQAGDPGTPHSGSLAATQALRGTYSVVRKLGMLDLRHDAEYLAAACSRVFRRCTKCCLRETRCATSICSTPHRGRRVRARTPRCCAPRPASPSGWRPLTRASPSWLAAIELPPPGVTLRGGDFEYQYSLRGDGTVPMALALLEGARHRYVECGHSDMPLSDRVIAGTIDLLKTGTTRRFRTSPPLSSARAPGSATPICARNTVARSTGRT